MSELLEKFSRINHLPLFPLPVVLFPGELLPLHIFEPRYRKMLKDAQLENNAFGLSYFSPENSLASRPEIGSLGCIAEIREVQTMDDGRANIITVGAVRYRLEDYIQSREPYLIGEISVFEDYESDPEILRPMADEVHRMFTRIARAAHKLSGAKTALPEIPPAEPQMLSFLVAAAFSLPPETKYELFETRSTIERLERLQSILQQSVATIEESAELNKLAKTNGHGKKKIDLDS